MSVSTRMRFEILKRDGFRCVYCGGEPGEAELRVDHVVPVARGGGDEPANLVTACFACNAGKSAVPLTVASRDVNTPASVVAERARLAAEIAADRVAHAAARDALAHRFLAKWEDAIGYATAGFRASIPRLVDEWDLADLDDALARTERKGLADIVAQGRYFHGILRAWRSQAEAEALTPEERDRRRRACLDAASAETDALKRANHRRAALRLAHDDSTLHHLGCDLYDAGCYDEALDAFVRLARVGGPSEAVAAGNASISAYNAGQYAAARAWAERAPERPQSQVVLGWLDATAAKAAAKAEAERRHRDEWARGRAYVMAVDAYDRCIARAELGGISDCDSGLAFVLPAALAGRSEVRLADLDEDPMVDLVWRAAWMAPPRVEPTEHRRAILRKAMRGHGWRAGTGRSPVWRPEVRA